MLHISLQDAVNGLFEVSIEGKMAGSEAIYPVRIMESVNS
jgi:hypothetical protein